MNILSILIVGLLLAGIVYLIPTKIAIVILMTALIVTCVLLVIVVLMQRSKSDGLAGGAAFGGSFTEQFFGAGTPAILVRITSWLGGIFFALTLALAILFSMEHRSRTGTVEKLLQQNPATNAAPAAASTNGAPAAATNSVARTNAAPAAK